HAGACAGGDGGDPGGAGATFCSAECDRMNVRVVRTCCHSRERGGAFKQPKAGQSMDLDGQQSQRPWVPARAGMTNDLLRAPMEGSAERVRVVEETDMSGRRMQVRGGGI